MIFLLRAGGAAIHLVYNAATNINMRCYISRTGQVYSRRVTHGRVVLLYDWSVILLPISLGHVITSLEP